MKKLKWTEIEYKNIEEIENELYTLKGKWVCRGQQKDFCGSLLPALDRKKNKDGKENRFFKTPRLKKLELERRSIETFRATAKYFLDDGERRAIQDDFVALMVLRHYEVPTRLLDWTMSPWIAACFAVEEESQDDEDGVIWAFENKQYEIEGEKQWKKYPETTRDGRGKPDKFDGNRITFDPETRADYIFCVFYTEGFPRLHAQKGLATISCQFAKDHGEMLLELLKRPDACRKYIIPKTLKKKLRETLQTKYKIDRFSLYPDTYGAAQLAAEIFKS